MPKTKNSTEKLEDVILLIEENEDDAFFFQRALKTHEAAFTVLVVPNSQAAIDYILGKGPYSDIAKHPFPRLIIISSKSISAEGDFLPWLKKNPQCKSVPILILSGSEDPSFVRKAYDLGVHSFLPKPRDLQEYGRVLKILLDYWDTCYLPELKDVERTCRIAEDSPQTVWHKP